VIGKDISYFVKHHSDSTKTFSETNIFTMLEYFIDNICLYVWWTCFSVGIQMGTDCAPLLANFYSFIRMRQTSKQGLLKKNEKKLAWPV